MTKQNTLTKVALVTGASSGFGKAIAEHLAARGVRVFGTNRGGTGSHARVTMLALDVDSDRSVAACIEHVMQLAGRIDVLVNNAGRAMVGACEETRADEARALFETNVFGTMRMVSAVLPIMRAQQGGAIVNVGSLSGFVGVPFHGVYSASKHALAGYTEALRHEVRPFGVRVCVVEPAAHRTTIRMERPQGLLPIYDRGRERVEAIIRGQIEQGGSAERVARLVAKAAESSAPRARYRIGWKAVLAAWALRLLPAGLFERGLRYEFQLSEHHP